MSTGVRVLLYVADPPGAPGSVEEAYHAVSHALAGTPGLVANTLLRSVDDPQAFAVLSEWTDLAAFRAWEETSDHRQDTAPLRPMQDAGRSSAHGIYEVAASYRD